VKYRNRDSLMARLRRRLESAEPPGALSLPEACAWLGVSPTTLRRRLDEEGRSFQQVKDAVRHAEALRLLSAPEAKVADVAVRLGFKEPSAFHRAFKRWEGATPGAARRPAGSVEPQ